MRARTLLSIITSLLLLSGVGSGATALTNRGEAPASPQTQVSAMGIDLERDDMFEQKIGDTITWSQAEHNTAVKQFLEAEAERKAAEAAAKAKVLRDAAAKAERERIAAANKAAGSRGSTRSTAVATELTSSQDVYDWLADCETGKRTKDSRGNIIILPGTRTNDAGGGFDGYFQFLPSTWTNLGNSGRAYQHPYSVQKAQAQRIPISSWNTQFPGCNKILNYMGVI